MDYNVKPILKWAGGKTQMLPQIIENLPNNFHKYKRYVEPFIGAGAVFLYLISTDCFEEYVINDINEKLVNLYIVIKEDCEGLLNELQQLKDEYMQLEGMDEKERYYYECREQFNLNEVNRTKMGALFIFLNKTCFNGLYRENSKGFFNVPFGKHASPGIYEEGEIRAISRVLNKTNEQGECIVKILNTSFENLYEYIDQETFVYFDPPYRPVTVGGFNSYSKSSFNDESQIRLNKFYASINEKGAKLMLSNSDPKVLDINDEFFDELYKRFIIKRVSANRMINSKGSGRGAITELLIMNYDKGEREVMSTSYQKNAETFDYLLASLKESIKGWNYFVNWDKVNANVKDIEIQLNILNYLVGKENVEEEAKYLLKKHPEVIKVIPILVACREKNFQIIFSDKTTLFKNKNYFFDNKILSDVDVEDAIEFMRESGVLQLFSNKTIKNVVDYVFGVEVGLDSNGRKNRSGHAMEDIVEKFVDKLCQEKGYRYLKEATPSVIKSEWGYDVTVDKSARRFDFVINTGKDLYLIETNYYSGGGSKLKATAGEYKTLYDIATKDGHKFIWVTDGKGWLTANRPLEETFYHNDYILNLTMLEKGWLGEIVK